MIRPSSFDRAIAARVGWPVAKLLVGLGLVVALLMGSWAATYSETEGLAATPMAEMTVTDGSGVVPAATAGGHAGEAGNLGAALCLLGVACCLALVVLARRAPSRTFSVERGAGLVRERIAVPSSRSPVLTLTQLRVFRT